MYSKRLRPHSFQTLQQLIGHQIHQETHYMMRISFTKPDYESQNIRFTSKRFTGCLVISGFLWTILTLLSIICLNWVPEPNIWIDTFESLLNVTRFDIFTWT